jgi:transcriptional regulator with PAS, ATPase and Fis domain
MAESKIGMIISSSKLAELAKGISDQIEIHNCSLENAIPLGRELESKGIEVIISLGGTAAVLEKHLSIPVLSIPLSAFDFMENVTAAARHGKKIGILLYGRPISKMEIFDQCLGVTVKQVIYHDLESLRAGVLQAKEEGLEVLIGGNTTCQIAEEIGLPAILITGSRDSVADVIEKAKIVSSIRREEKEKTKRIEAIVNSVSEGIIAIDKTGMIRFFNHAAQEILEMSGDVGSHIDMVVPQLGLNEVLKAGVPKLQSLRKVGKIQIVVNAVPILLSGKVIGATASFSDVPKVMRVEQKVRSSLARRFVAKYTVDNIIHTSKAMTQVIHQMARFADSDSTVLIMGESGTGKELVANSMHNLSQRRYGPFVAINCLAIPEENLLKSELFGHEEGAFTGARRGGKAGLFELAHRGTIFLDEIGSIPENLQVGLLRVLEQKEVMRIGGDRMIPVDVWVIVATNKDLLEEVRAGRMREDLYFRLSVLRLYIPPLRERKEDIPPLVSSLFDAFSTKYGKKIGPLPERLLQKFLEYPWPGNVRELQNLMERLILLQEGPDSYDTVVDALFEDCRETGNLLGNEVAFPPREDDLKALFGNPFATKLEVAKKLGISRTTLWRRLKGTGPVSN